MGLRRRQRGSAAGHACRAGASKRALGPCRCPTAWRRRAGRHRPHQVGAGPKRSRAALPDCLSNGLQPLAAALAQEHQRILKHLAATSPHLVERVWQQ